MFILYSFNGVEEYAVEDHEIVKLAKPLFNLLGGCPIDLDTCYTILKLAKAKMHPGEILYGDPLYILERVDRYEDRKAFAERSLSLPEGNCSSLFEGAYHSIEKVCEKLHPNRRTEEKKQ